MPEIKPTLVNNQLTCPSEYNLVKKELKVPSFASIATRGEVFEIPTCEKSGYSDAPAVKNTDDSTSWLTSLKRFAINFVETQTRYTANTMVPTSHSQHPPVVQTSTIDLDTIKEPKCHSSPCRIDY